MIPDDVKPLVQSCGHPKAYDGESPCGTCPKCEEYQAIMEDII